MNIIIGNLIYQGKAKGVYETNDPEKVVVEFRDDITAGDGAKKDRLSQKGYWNSIISAKFFEILEDTGVKTQYIDLIKPGCMLSWKLDMIPLEVITRNIAAGSLLRRYPFEPQQTFDPPIIQIDYKSDEYGDPMLNDDIAIALGLTDKEKIKVIKETTFKINKVLKDFLESKGLLFPDFKIEYGYDNYGNIVLGDEISPDTCRFWDSETCDVLDKDLFRQGESGVIEAYKRVASVILDEEDKKRWKINI
ncbi:MAG: phosphoribosylaminoimidazolesuccinocarboxamide synthase [Methanobacterium sp.]